MKTRHLIAWSVAAFAISISVGHAGPCSPQIDSMQARIDARLRANAMEGRTATEGQGALIHRQPTPGSIAAAEEKLGEVPAGTIALVRQEMERARAADNAGDKRACEEALAVVDRTIRQ